MIVIGAWVSAHARSWLMVLKAPSEGSSFNVGLPLDAKRLMQQLPYGLGAVHISFDAPSLNRIDGRSGHARGQQRIFASCWSAPFFRYNLY
jgi:hypothetical protein